MSGIETGYRPPESFELSREDKKLNADLERLYVKKLKEGRIGHLIKVLFSDPAMRARLTEIHEDKMVNVLDPKGFQDSPERFSSLVVSIMRDKELRSVFIEMVNREFQDHTTLLSGAIRKSNERFESDPEHLEEEDVAALVYDEVSIGGGVHGAIYATAMATDNMSVKSLLVESGKEIFGQFRTKNFVSINSPNVPHERITPLHALRQGNLNYLGRSTPVQIPYIESRRFPTGNVFADAATATANLYFTNTEVMIGTKVTRVVKPQDDSQSALWPARYKVEFSNGFFVFANRVNRMTGLGASQLTESFEKEEKWGSRTEKMAQLNAEIATGALLPRLDLHEKRQPILFEKGQLDSYGVDVDSTNIEAATLTTQIEMKVAIANAFDRFDFVQHGNSEVHLTFHRTRVGSDKSKLEIVFDPNIDDAQERALVRDMVTSDVCSDVMALIGKGRYDLFEVTVPIGAKGKVRSDEMSIRFSRFKE